MSCKWDHGHRIGRNHSETMYLSGPFTPGDEVPEECSGFIRGRSLGVP